MLDTLVARRGLGSLFSPGYNVSLLGVDCSAIFFPEVPRTIFAVRVLLYQLLVCEKLVDSCAFPVKFCTAEYQVKSLPFVPDNRVFVSVTRRILIGLV